MWPRKTKNGNWRFVDTFKNPQTNKWQEVSVTFGKNNAQVRKQAQLLLDQKIKNKLIEIQGGETKITLSQLIKKYLKLAKKQLADSTYYKKVHSLNRIKKDLGGELILKNVNTPFLNKYFDKRLYEDDLSNPTVQSYKADLSVLYEFGINYGYLKNNPVTRTKPTWKNEREKKKNEIESKYLDDDELAKILNDCKQQNRIDLHDFFYWLYLTGMRCGEGAAIQKKNILQDKDGNWFARVRGSLVTKRKVPKNQRHEKSNSGKTGNSNRDVLLPPEAVKLVKKHSKNKKLDDLIFTNEWKTSSGYFTPSKLDNVLKSIAKRQGLKKTPTTHFFRHTHVSKLAERGVPLYIVQRRVGHGNSRITEQIYLHVTSKAKQELANKINTLGDDIVDKPSLRIIGK